MLTEHQPFMLRKLQVMSLTSMPIESSELISSLSLSLYLFFFSSIYENIARHFNRNNYKRYEQQQKLVSRFRSSARETEFM